jgi:endonuclease/exonuclease/phosphatase family metal-dependent hydrolase
MTFNVRYPAPGDGPNRWEYRRDMVVRTIRETNPDIFGTQELFYEPGLYIADKAAEYAWFGSSRLGNLKDEYKEGESPADEHNGIFYKKATLRLLESGDFWLSDTPDTPGSNTWDLSEQRLVTWGLFEIKANKRRFYLLDTHFPHRRQEAEARLKSARLILERITRLRKGVPAILTGDFNSPAGGEVYKVIEAVLTDTWPAAMRRSGPESTTNGFRGATGGPRIDWIFFRGPLKVLEAETITRSENGRYPSDHFPVLVVFQF